MAAVWMSVSGRNGEPLFDNQRHRLQVCWPSNTARSARGRQVIWLLRFLVYSAIQMTSHCRGGKETSWALKDKHATSARLDPSSGWVRVSDRHDDGAVWKDAGHQPAAAVKKKKEKENERWEPGFLLACQTSFLNPTFHFLTTYRGTLVGHMNKLEIFYKLCWSGGKFGVDDC